MRPDTHIIKAERYAGKVHSAAGAGEMAAKEICQRRKRGLVAPGKEWLRGELPEFARGLLSTRALNEKGYFNAHAVKNLLKQHSAKHRNWHRLLAAILGVQLWGEIFAQKRIGDFEPPPV